MKKFICPFCYRENPTWEHVSECGKKWQKRQEERKKKEWEKMKRAQERERKKNVWQST